MIKGIAFLKHVEEQMQQKTGFDIKIIQANTKYINKRLKEFMEMEDVHSVRLTGLCVIDENYNQLRKKGYKFKENKYYNILRKKAENLKILTGKMDVTKTIPFLLKPPFLYRRRYKLTDEELEMNQNE